MGSWKNKIITQNHGFRFWQTAGHPDTDFHFAFSYLCECGAIGEKGGSFQLGLYDLDASKYGEEDSFWAHQEKFAVSEQITRYDQEMVRYLHDSPKIAITYL